MVSGPSWMDRSGCSVGDLVAARARRREELRVRVVMAMVVCCGVVGSGPTLILVLDLEGLGASSFGSDVYYSNQ